LSKRYHPDNFIRTAPKDVAQLVEKVFRAIETAYAVLATPAQRKGYDRKMSDSAAASSKWNIGCGSAVRMCANEVARSAFEDGVELYNRGAYLAALGKFNEAVRIQRTMARYRFYLGKTLAQLPGRERDAEFQYRVAVQQAAWNEEYKSALKQLRQSPGLQERAEPLISEAVAALESKPQTPKNLPRQ
jgi:DnaJ-class molecular chaperone